MGDGCEKNKLIESMIKFVMDICKIVFALPSYVVVLRYSGLQKGRLGELQVLGQVLVVKLDKF